MLPALATHRRANMAEDVDEVVEPDDIDADDLGDLDEDDLVEGLPDDDDGDDDDVGIALDEDDDVEDAVEPVIPVASVAAVAEENEDDDDEVDDEDVEASLDEILKERLVVEDAEEDEEVPELDDRSEPTERVLPKQPDEFVCSSCFLVKHPGLLADPARGLCRDCV